MIDLKRRMKLALPVPRVLAVLVLIVTAWPALVLPATAQSDGMASMDIGASGPNGQEVGARFTVTTLDGTDLGSCTLEGNGDEPYRLSCRVDVPLGTTVVVTIDVTTITPGYAPVENPLYFDTSTGPGAASHWGVFFQIEPIGGSVSTGQTSDVAIATTENGGSATDVCYVLVDFSNEGCDRNDDGQVTFEDVPLGTYTVVQTADLGAGRSVPDFTIQVTGNMGSSGWELVAAVAVAAAPATAPDPQPSQVLWPELTGAVDISLITRDPANANLLTGACYVLVDYSNEGCDENGDGQVTFDAIPYGTYTVQQTRTPAGYPTINDYDIEVWPLENLPGGRTLEVPLGFLVRQAQLQNAPNTRNVSVILIDAATGQKVVADICVELVGGSIVGCDGRIRDGQIDFLDVPADGPYELRFSEVPAGWRVGIEDEPHTVVVDPQPGSPSILFAFILVDMGNAAGPGTDGGAVTTETGAIAVVGGQTTGTTPGDTSSGDTTSSGVAVELILDTSGSMDERDQGGQTRMEVAKEVTTRLVTETLPAGVPMALRTYSGCSSSLAMPMQPLDPNAAATTIAGLRASGDTPIAQSLRAAGDDLDAVSGPKIIVLVTDGEETCGGDPRAAIEALVAQDVDVQVNIVGFAIDDAELAATFQEWARVGNGTYYEASDEIELDQAVTTAAQLSFRVIDQQGTVIAEGTVGGDAVAVPAGTWTVEIDTVPVTVRENVIVTAQQTTTIDLDASGTTDAGGEAVDPDQGENAQVIVPIVPQDGAQDPAGSAQPTWTASVQVNLCDAPPNSGSEMNCHAEGGIVVNISLASGEWLGSCAVGDPQPTPWDTFISTCTVEGLPHNADFVATQDPSTIPAGYAPHEESLYLQVDDLIPGGGDQATFTFFNVRTDAGSTGSSGTTDSGSPGEATLLMTFRGCPEGFDPATGDFYAECMIPLDAPGASFLSWGGDGQGGDNIAFLDRQYNGEYVFIAGPGTMNLEFSGLAPVVRNAYQVIGADGVTGDTYTVDLVDGETREIFVFYYYE